MPRTIRLNGGAGGSVRGLSPEIAIPPGAYVMRFYREGELDYDASGFDGHPQGASLIMLVAYLVVSSSDGDVLLSIKKNEQEFYELKIPESERLVQVKLSEMVMPVSMEFRAFTDTLQVEITDPGVDAEQLTVLGVFDR